jgi:radical SAM peptide maturase (CXXX-repeat target family)
MNVYKLEKDIKLYKNQFEKLMLNIFKSHKMERLSIDLDSLLFRIKYMYIHNKDLNKIPKLKDEFVSNALELRKVFGDFIFNLLVKVVGIDKYSLNDIIDILSQEVKMDSVYVTFKMILISANREYLEYVNSAIPENDVYDIDPNNFSRFFVDSYNDGIAKAYPELFESNRQNELGIGNDSDIFVHNLTFQTTESCNLFCKYCYQFNKTPMRMKFETAKEFIDNLLNDKYGYLNRYNSPAIILEFIGGEPLLEIDLTRQIYEYFLDRAYDIDHPWFKLHRVSLCSNGLQYFDDNVQSFFKDYSHMVSFNISIDGNKELHDSCRVQHTGEGSYDVAMVALNHFNRNYTPERNSKMTLAPSNISYLFESVVDFIKNGMKTINLNCVFEEGWNKDTALIEYHQLKKLAEYILEHDLEKIYISIFNERQEDTNLKSFDGSFCFKKGTQILTEDGHRNIEDLRVGDRIYTASGNLHKVVKLNKRVSNDNRKLYISGAFPLECTNDHKIFAKKFLYMGWKGKIHYSDPGFYPVSELKKGDRVALPILDISKNKENWLTDDMAYALGVYIADGYIGGNTVNITPGYDKDRFYLNCLKKVGLLFRERSQRTSMRYEIVASYSQLNEKFYKLCLLCGAGSHLKHIPYIIFESPRHIIEKVLEGYLETDGYQVPLQKYNGGNIKINTVSSRLANDIMILLRALNQFPTCYFYKRAGAMYIENRLVNVKDRYEIYHNPIRPNGNNNFKLDDEYPIMWSGIRSIENVTTEDNYFCPTIMPIDDGLEEHSIIANTIAVENCGGTGSMLSIRPNGQFYPCIRYMPTSVGDNVKDLSMGSVQEGMIGRSDGSEVLKIMDAITRRSQLNDICYDCPIGNDCPSCIALSHTVYGTPTKRTSFICIMMISEALSNLYYWNLLNIKHPEYNLGVRKNNIPDKWSLLVIDQDELDFLKLIELRSMISTMGYNGEF